MVKGYYYSTGLRVNFLELNSKIMHETFNAVVKKSKAEIRVCEIITGEGDKQVKTYANLDNPNQVFAAADIELGTMLGTIPAA